ncbi:hypothetical protein ACFYZJ_32520 [Streptomyces sp. NPDC001848]|uniref:hypothetical protein n=1 Tax=Streptomyces sp. NPDC001848 TaxID=3364618 RepID=UPI0036D1F34C
MGQLTTVEYATPPVPRPITFLRHPEHPRHDPGLLPQAVEEPLRYELPEPRPDWCADDRAAG